MSLEAFRSFVDRQSLTLPTQGLHLLKAPSGFGKSSLIEAVAFPFGYSSYPATELQSWLTETPLQVDLELTLGEKNLILKKGKKAFLQVSDEAPITSTVSVNQRLPELIGIPIEYLKLLTYRPQREPGLFLSKTDIEKKELLTTLLHLDKAEIEIEATQKKISSLEKELEICKAKISQCRALVPSEPILPDLLPFDFRKKEITSRVEFLSCELQEQRNILSSLVTQKESNQKLLENKKKSIYGKYISQINDLKTRIATIKEEKYQPNPELPQKLSVLKSRLSFIQGEIAKVQTAYRSELNNISDDISTLKASLSNAKAELTKIEQSKKEKDKYEKELTILKSGVCHTCKQIWENDPSKQQYVSKTLDKIEILSKIINKESSVLSFISDIEQNIASLVQKQKELQNTDPVSSKLTTGEREYQQYVGEATEQLRNEISNWKIENEAKINALRGEIGSLESKQSTELSDLLSNNQNDKLSLEIEGLKTKITSIETEIRDLLAEKNSIEFKESSAKREFEIMNQAYTKSLKALHDEESTFKEYESALGKEKDFHFLAKSFINLIFEETLEQVAAKTNEIIEDIPNVAGMILRFITEKLTKSGTSKQQITPIIMKDGRVIPFRSGCSGGQQSTIELAVDLALASVVSERTGFETGWLFLDEPFGGLGPEDKDSLLALLSKVAENKAIFVVDHTGVGEQFSSVIEILNKNGSARISV
jgi:DNA repair exonuclease SbcCD ATPase subunit